jgi:hypothetical protein
MLKDSIKKIPNQVLCVWCSVLILKIIVSVLNSIPPFPEQVLELQPTCHSILAPAKYAPHLVMEVVKVKISTAKRSS